jgi:hypothetical protein
MKLTDILGGSLLSGVKDIIGSLKLDPAKKAEIEQHLDDNRQIIRLKELELQDKLQEQVAVEIKTTAANIQAEASSTDKWTSRARPSFLYVMYIIILSAIPFSMFFAFRPDKAKLVTEGFGLWLAAIPDQLYWLFGAGYLGYTGARSVQEWNKNRGK